MITLQQFFETIDYQITDSDTYDWSCYGSHARILDYWNKENGDKSVSISVVFDTKTQFVYQMEVWYGATDVQYRWIHPGYIEAYAAESISRNISFDESIDGNHFIDLDVAEDILEKARAIFKGESFDERVIVQLDINDEDKLLLMSLAHDADMTVNHYVEKILRDEIARRSDDA